MGYTTEAAARNYLEAIKNSVIQTETSTNNEINSTTEETPKEPNKETNVSKSEEKAKYYYSDEIPAEVIDEVNKYYQKNLAITPIKSSDYYKLSDMAQKIVDKEITITKRPDNYYLIEAINDGQDYVIPDGKILNIQNGKNALAGETLKYDSETGKYHIEPNGGIWKYTPEELKNATLKDK